MYDKLAGMTGTAKTQLPSSRRSTSSAMEIPTNRDMVRKDNQDEIYKNEEAKWNAVVDDIAERNGPDSRSWWARSRSRSPNCSRET